MHCVCVLRRYLSAIYRCPTMVFRGSSSHMNAPRHPPHLRAGVPLADGVYGSAAKVNGSGKQDLGLLNTRRRPPVIPSPLRPVYRRTLRCPDVIPWWHVVPGNLLSIPSFLSTNVTINIVNQNKYSPLMSRRWCHLERRIQANVSPGAHFSRSAPQSDVSLT